MRVLGYTWAGVRSTDLESTVHFFAETLGGKVGTLFMLFSCVALNKKITT
jgi:hypothetical protein